MSRRSASARPAAARPSRNPAPAVVHELVALFSGRRYEELERQASAVVAEFPDFAFGWKALAVARLLGGGDALEAAGRAAELLPGDAEAWNNYARALLAAGRAAESRDACLRALRIDPHHALSFNNLGNAWRRLGDPARAGAAYADALARLPRFADAAFNLGTLLAETGDDRGATTALERALELQPGHGAAARALAALFARSGRFAPAATLLGGTRPRLPPDSPLRAALDDDRAALLIRLGRHEEALQAANAALAVDPARATAHNHRGLALLELGRMAEARAAFGRAVELDPTLAAAQMNLGNVLLEFLQPADAVAAYQRAVATDPANPDLASNLLLTACMLDDPDRPPLAAAIACQNLRATPRSDWPNAKDPGRRLRVGLLSGDLREHPVGRFLVAPLATLGDHGIELFAYHNHWLEDAVSDALRSRIPHWRNVFGVSDAALGERVAADGIDLLVDLAGHTEGNRLNVLAAKPAPVQVAWFGYFATTGLAAIDYVLADPNVLPPGCEDEFVERVWRLPASYYCFTPPLADLAPGLRSASPGPSFGCFNRIAKLNDRVIGCWAGILDRVAGSVLFLKARQLASPEIRAAVVARFAAHGIAEHRLRLEGPDRHDRYLAAYRDVDLVLDPFPFTGGATTAEALWMGVPVLTLKGDRFIGRQGETILRAVGLDDWIAADRADYIDRAVSAVGPGGRAARLRGELRSRLLASPFCDAPRFAADLAAAWRGMWSTWCATGKGH